MSGNSSSGQPTAARTHRSPVPDLEENQTLSLLFDLSRELTAILERDELFQRIRGPGQESRRISSVQFDGLE